MALDCVINGPGLTVIVKDVENEDLPVYTPEQAAILLGNILAFMKELEEMQSNVIKQG